MSRLLGSSSLLLTALYTGQPARAFPPSVQIPSAFGELELPPVPDAVVQFVGHSPGAQQMAYPLPAPGVESQQQNALRGAMQHKRPAVVCGPQVASPLQQEG